MPFGNVCNCFKGRRKQVLAVSSEATPITAPGPSDQQRGVAAEVELPLTTRKILMLASVDGEGALQQQKQQQGASSFLHTVTLASIEAASTGHQEAVALVVFEARIDAACDVAGGDEVSARRVNSDAFNFQVMMNSDHLGTKRNESAI